MGIVSSFSCRTRQFILLIGLLGFGVPLSGQAWLAQPVALSTDEESRASLLFALSEQVGVGLAFNASLPAFRERITIDAQGRPAGEVLGLILAGTPITFKASATLLTLQRPPVVISGFLEDATSGERLIGGNVYAPRSQRGTTTNNYGFFSLEVPASDSLVRFSYLGYETALRPRAATERVRLRPAGDLPEVVVLAYSKNDDAVGEREANTGLRISGLQLRQHGGLGGESRIFDLLHQTTDSQRGADGLGGLFVRGGGADQNLVLLDDVPIFQPSHAFGLFSVINPSIVRSAAFYQDGFPARFGGRLGAVLDVRSREGNTERATAGVAFSAIATKLNVEVPTFKHKGALLLAARRTHLDPLLKGASRRRKNQNGEDGKANYDFYDLNLKWHHAFTRKDKIYLSGYRGGDAYSNENLAFFNQEEDGEEIDIVQEFIQDLGWGNTSGTLRWNHLFNDRLFANTTLTYGKYGYSSENLLDTEEATTNDTITTFFYGRFASVIRDLNLKVDFDYYRNDHHWRFGAFALARRFVPGAIMDEVTLDTIRKETFITEAEELFVLPGFTSREGGVYLEDQLKLNTNWQLTAGLRFTAYRYEEITRFLPQPRLGLSWQGAQRRWARLTLGRMVQPLHLLTNSGANLPTDLWVPATDGFAPQDSWQASFAAGWSPRPKWRVDVNAYYKSMRRLLRYAEERSWPGLEESSAEFWEEDVVSGRGFSYGASLKFAYQGELQTLSGGYFFGRSFRVFSGLNAGEVFPFSFDRPHKIILNLTRRLIKKLRLNAHWELTSGRPITLLEADTSFDPLDNFPTSNLEQLSDLNGFRLPAYHRLDLGLEWRWQKKHRRSLRLGVYNIYNRANAYYAYDFTDSFTGADTEEREVRSLPILPSVSYSVYFGK